MKKKILVFCLGMTFPLCLVLASFEERPFSARSAALGESMVAVIGTESSYYNPAGLAFLSGTGVVLGHTELYSLDELDHTTAGVSHTTKKIGSWGAYGTSFGSALYRETEMGVSWAVHLTSTSAVGITVKRQDLRLERYGGIGAWQSDLGVVSRPIPKVTLGATVHNVTQSRLSGTSESPSSSLVAGATGELWARGLTTLSVVQQSGGETSWRVGQEVLLHSVLAVRAGFETAPNRFTLGAGFCLRRCRLDYAFLTHASLPDQHFFTLSWQTP